MLKALTADYRFKNRRVSISCFINGSQGKCYAIRTKRLASFKNRIIAKHEMIVTEETLKSMLYCINEFRQGEFKKAKEYNATELIEHFEINKNGKLTNN